MNNDNHPVSFWPYQSKDYPAEIEQAVAAHRDKYGTVRRVWINMVAYNTMMGSNGDKPVFDKTAGHYLLNDVPLYVKSGCRSCECMVFS